MDAICVLAVQGACRQGDGAEGHNSSRVVSDATGRALIAELLTKGTGLSQ